MSWSIGYDGHWKRDIGYGVPAYCDHPSCNATIDRGLSFVCGGEPYGGEKGCGLYFCSKHMRGLGQRQRCPKCARYDYNPYPPKPEHPQWIEHKLTDPSWQEWREANPDEVKKLSQPQPAAVTHRRYNKPKKSK
jgi:hypothetical protein